MPPARRRRVFAALGLAAMWLAGAVVSWAQVAVPRGELLQEADDHPVDPNAPVPVEKAVRFTLRGSDLSVTSEFTKTTDNAAVHVVDLEGVEGATRIEISRRRGPSWMIPVFDLRHNGSLEGGGGTVQARISSQASYVRIDVTTVIGDRRMNVLLSQDSNLSRRNRWTEQLPAGERVSLRISETWIAQRALPEVKVSAGSFAELLLKDPDRTLRYLGPIFRRFGQDAAVFRVDDRVGWQVFPDAVDVDDATESKVLALVGRLDAGDFRQRERATADLDTIGGPAVRVLRDVGRSTLTAEQNTRVSAILARYAQFDESEVAELSENPAFLLRCFTYCEIEPVRSAAARALAGKLGNEIDLDAEAKLPDRVLAADKVWEKIPEEK